MKIFIASFNRASIGAMSKLKQKMIDEGFYTDDYNQADYILACGDRVETFDFVLNRWREGKKIIHLWAGEISQGTYDEVYRHSMTLMSDIQLCTNDEAKTVVKQLCKAVGKTYFVFTVGNIMLDNLALEEFHVKKPYDLILYNPPTLLSRDEIQKEIDYIDSIKSCNYIWVAPNGDNNSDMLKGYTTTINLPRPMFLSLIKNCNRFITNSSCEFYEAPFLMDKNNIIHVGVRNSERNSKTADMTLTDASDNIIKILRWLNDEKI